MDELFPSFFRGLLLWVHTIYSCFYEGNPQNWLALNFGNEGSFIPIITMYRFIPSIPSGMSNQLVSWFIAYLRDLQPTYIGVISQLLSTMDIPVLRASLKWN